MGSIGRLKRRCRAECSAPEVGEVAIRFRPGRIEMDSLPVVLCAQFVHLTFQNIGHIFARANFVHQWVGHWQVLVSGKYRVMRAGRYSGSPVGCFHYLGRLLKYALSWHRA